VGLSLAIRQATLEEETTSKQGRPDEAVSYIAAAAALTAARTRG
jgi:hypothetical protein